MKDWLIYSNYTTARACPSSSGKFGVHERMDSKYVATELAEFIEKKT
jgi:hypothetical protein